MGDSFDLEKARYDRVVLLMDPDADGIHCGALLLMFFRRWMQPLLENGRIAMARAPLATIRVTDGPIHVRSENEYRLHCERLLGAGTAFESVRYRGLAGMDLAVLATTCVDPTTRVLSPVGIADADAAIAVFGGSLI